MLLIFLTSFPEGTNGLLHEKLHSRKGTYLKFRDLLDIGSEITLILGIRNIFVALK